MIQKDKQIKLDLPKNYAASEDIKRLLYIENEDTNFQNKIIDLVNNRTDLQKYLLATSGYGDFIKDAKKNDIQNPIIGGLLSQVEANKLEDNIIKQKLEDFENREIASRLIGLRLPSGKNNNSNDDGDSRRFGNMDFKSGKLSFLPPQRTALPTSRQKT